MGISRKDVYEPVFIESGAPARLFSEFPTNKDALKFIAVNDSILAAYGFSEFKIVNPNEGQIGVLEYAFSDSLAFLRINGMEGVSDLKSKKQCMKLLIHCVAEKD